MDNRQTDINVYTFTSSARTRISRVRAREYSGDPQRVPVCGVSPRSPGADVGGDEPMQIPAQMWAGVGPHSPGAGVVQQPSVRMCVCVRVCVCVLLCYNKYI